MKELQASPAVGQVRNQGENMDLIAYWQKFVAPYIQARFGSDEKGASLVEYALLVGLIAVVCIGAVSVLGGKAASKFSSIGNSLQ
jgi:pilus assembly protein Flp/PilA